MTLTEVVERACQEPDFIAALTFVAIWESERVVVQARGNPTWETCFAVSFRALADRWQHLHGMVHGV